MASIQKHTSKNRITTWRAQLSVNGVRNSKCGFDSKSDAKIWAALREAEILSDVTVPISEPTIQPDQVITITHKTIGDVFDRYAREVSPSKTGARDVSLVFGIAPVWSYLGPFLRT